MAANKAKCCCQVPEKLKRNPENCSPQRIRACHGTSGNHPCVPKKTSKKLAKSRLMNS